MSEVAPPARGLPCSGLAGSEAAPSRPGARPPGHPESLPGAAQAGGGLRKLGSLTEGDFEAIGATLHNVLGS